MRNAGRHGCRDKIDMLAQLLRVRPRNAQALSAKSINNKVGAIGAEVCFRTGLAVDGEFAAAENIGETKLLGDGSPKSSTGQPAQFQNRRLANLAVNRRARAQAQRSAMQMSIEEIVDLAERKNGLGVRNLNFFPGRLSRRPRDKADLIRAKTG